MHAKGRAPASLRTSRNPGHDLNLTRGWNIHGFSRTFDLYCPRLFVNNRDSPLAEDSPPPNIQRAHST